MPDASPNIPPVTADTDPLVQQLLAKFSTPPAAPNLAPFTKAKEDIARQEQALPVPQPPTLQQIPQNVPAAQVTPIFQAMTPDLMLFAALGGALTRAPIASAVENMTGFITGLQKGDAEATKQHLDEFNARLDAAKAANANAIDQYKLVFDKYNGDVQKLKDEGSAVALAQGDAVQQYNFEVGRFDEAYKVADARLRLQEQIQNHQDMVNLRIDGHWGPTVDLTLKDGKHIQGQRNGITGQYRDESGDPIDRQTVQGEQKIGVAPRSAPALALQKFMQEHPDATPEQVTKFAADYAQQVKAARDWGTGPLGNQARSFNVGLYHLATLQELSDALKNGDIKAFNSIANKWAAETGNAAPTNFDTARQIIGAEVVKAIVGAGGGGVQERLEAANHISTSLSPEQMAGAIGTTKDLMVGQLKGLKQQYERTTKQDDFEDVFLSPEAKTLFDSSSAKAPPHQWKYTAASGDTKIHSDDGVNWFKDDGSIYQQ